MLVKLTKKYDFNQVMKLGQRFFVESFYIKVLKNNLANNRYGIMISLKVDKKAVVRNKIRRRFNEILRLNDLKIKQGYDIVILAKDVIKNTPYSQNKQDLGFLLQRANLLKK